MDARGPHRREDLIAQRLRAGFSQESLSQALGASLPTISAWERGVRNPRPRQRPLLADALGVSLAALDRMLDPGAPPELNGHRVPSWLNTYESLVLEAGRFEMVARSVVPTMLQTRGYAAGVERCVPGLTDAEVDERVKVRLARQSVLERQPDPLHLVAVLHQGMFRDVVGGPDVMANQCDHLLTMAERPNVEILILPSDGRATYCPGEFELLVKRDEIAPFMGITIDPGGASYHERDVGDFAVMFMYALGIALPPDESIRCIRDTRESYR